MEDFVKKTCGVQNNVILEKCTQQRIEMRRFFTHLLALRAMTLFIASILIEVTEREKDSVATTLGDKLGFERTICSFFE